MARFIAGLWNATKTPAPCEITENNFVYKSLSNWALNFSVGCAHACRFCYVPSSSTNKQAPLLRELGVGDPDAEWGEYVFLREWDEEAFLKSLRKAERTPVDKLKPDGNRAILLCSTTDAFQVIRHPDSTEQKKLQDHQRHIVRRSLELIRDHSTLNVRILTRSPLVREEFPLLRSFGNRLVLGMSIPTLRNDLAKIYEPKAPALSVRLETLKAASKAGIPVFIAVAPTYPECDQDDLTATLTAVQGVNPITVFHEPINIRAENVERIKAHATELGLTLQTQVFESPAAWQKYAVDALKTVERVAAKVGIEDRLHLWPDKRLGSDFALRMVPQEVREGQAQWLKRWWSRISEWPQSGSATVPDELNPTDQSYLAAREKIVAHGIKASIAAAKALYEIFSYRSGVLWREYGSFEAYCRIKWDYAKSHAYRLKEAGDFVVMLEEHSPNGEKPKSESQIRPLLSLPREKRIAVWESVSAERTSGPVTGRLVAAKTKEHALRLGLPAQKTPKPRVANPAEEFFSSARLALEKFSGAELDEMHDRWKWLRHENPENEEPEDWFDGGGRDRGFSSENQALWVKFMALEGQEKDVVVLFFHLIGARVPSGIFLAGEWERWMVRALRNGLLKIV